MSLGKQKYKVVVIGVSAGGLQALSTVLPMFGKEFPLPILVVQHLIDEPESYLTEHLSQCCCLTVVDPEDKSKIEAGNIYIAPPGYHMEVEKNYSLSFSFDPLVAYSRPSIDVLFNSVADVYRESAVAVIMTGANSDGTNGIKNIKNMGGVTISQDPDTAEVSMMPQSAINSGCIDKILKLEEIAGFINSLIKDGNNE